MKIRSLIYSLALSGVSSLALAANVYTPPLSLGVGVTSALGNAVNTTGGLVLLNGSPTVGNLLTWSASGAQDSGILTGAFTFPASTGLGFDFTTTVPVYSATGQFAIGALWSTFPTLTTNGQAAVYASTTGGASNIGWGTTFDWLVKNHSGNNVVGNGTGSVNLNTYGSILPFVSGVGSIGFTSNWYQGIYSQTLNLLGSSTGYVTISTNYAGVGNPVITVPGFNDTMATLGTAQTFTGANAFSGAPATSAANTTTIYGGSTAFTPANGGSLGIGSLSAPAALSVNGTGVLSLSNANGLQLSGRGTGNDVTLYNRSGTAAAGVPTGTTNLFVVGGVYWATLINNVTSRVLDSAAAPTSPTNGTIVAANQNGSGAIVMTATGTPASMTFTLSAASTRWVCQFTNETTPGAQIIATSTSTVVTLTNYVAGVATNFASGAVATGLCRAV